MKVISFVVTGSSGLMLGSDVESNTPSVCETCKFFSENPELNCKHSEFAYCVRIGAKPIITSCDYREEKSESKTPPQVSE